MLFPVQNGSNKHANLHVCIQVKLFRVIRQNPHTPLVAVSEAGKGLESGPLDPFSLQRGDDVFC